MPEMFTSDWKGEVIDIGAACFICDADLEVHQVQTHLKTEHPDDYAMMIEIHRNEAGEKQAGGIMIAMAVVRKYRDEKDWEKMKKRLSILVEELDEMGIEIRGVRPN